MNKIPEAISVETANYLAKGYNALNYYTKLQDLLKAAYPNNQFNLPKYELHKLVNTVLINNYNGEEILKYKLFQESSKKRNIVGAFEIKVNNSRIDFLTINGETTGYEIKSELDNLSKIKKQISDYALAFEYNYLVIDSKHEEKIKELAPLSFGMWVYKGGRYKKLRRAKLNKDINPEIQLGLLLKKESKEFFPEGEGKIKRILCVYSPDQINEGFKNALKQRYRDRWMFLTRNKENIFPMDLQFFFNTNILPGNIYHY